MVRLIGEAIRRENQSCNGKVTYAKWVHAFQEKIMNGFTLKNHMPQEEKKSWVGFLSDISYEFGIYRFGGPSALEMYLHTADA